MRRMAHEMVRGILVASLTFASLGAGVARGDDLPQLAVMDLSAGGVSEDLISVVSASVARAARDTEAFSVISGSDIRALLTLEAQKQLCGVEAESCLAEIGGALGADYMIQGGLKKIGGQTILDLVLLEVSRAKVLNRVSRSVKGAAGELIDEVPNATVQLLSKALEGRLGTMVVSVSEAGASVKIDGRIIGVSPLPQQKIPAGVHLIEVEKAGFITAKEQVVVKADETVARGVQMVPSPDFVEAYSRSARRMRLGAWISVGAMVAALGTGGTFHYLANQTEKKFLGDRATYNKERTQKLYDNLVVTSKKGLGQQTASTIGYSVAGAALVSSLYFFIAGDEPGRYGGVASLTITPALVPTEGGAYASLSLRF